MTQLKEQTTTNEDFKRCYIYWQLIGEYTIAGGKVIWLTEREKTLAYLKHSRLELIEVLDEDKVQKYKKYLDQTIE